MRIEIGQINFVVMLLDHSYTTRLPDLTSLRIRAIWWSLQPWHIQKVPPLWSPVLHPLQYCDVYFFLEWIPLNGHSLQYPLALCWRRLLFVICPCLTTTVSWFILSVCLNWCNPTSCTIFINEVVKKLSLLLLEDKEGENKPEISDCWELRNSTESIGSSSFFSTGTHPITVEMSLSTIATASSLLLNRS